MGQAKKNVLIIGLSLILHLTCKDTNSSGTSSRNISFKKAVNPIPSNLSPKSENPTDDFALVVSGKLSIGEGKTFYVNGPLADVCIQTLKLADVCIQTLKNEGNFKVTGKLSVGTLQGEGQLEYEEIEEGAKCDVQVSPTPCD